MYKCKLKAYLYVAYVLRHILFQVIPSPLIVDSTFPNLTMHLTLPVFTLLSLPFALGKLCSLHTGRPEPCDYDRWHQERKSTIGPSVRVDVQCYSLGRTVQGSAKWLYIRDRECWIPLKVLGPGCAGKFQA